MLSNSLWSWYFFREKAGARRRDALFDTFVPNAEQPGMIFVILLPEYRVYSLYKNARPLAASISTEALTKLARFTGS